MIRFSSVCTRWIHTLTKKWARPFCKPFLANNLQQLVVKTVEVDITIWWLQWSWSLTLTECDLPTKKILTTPLDLTTSFTTFFTLGTVHYLNIYMPFLSWVFRSCYKQQKYKWTFHTRTTGPAGSIAISSFIALTGLPVIEANHWLNIFPSSFYKNVLETVEVDSEIYTN